jgi:FkbM family methyltransferase
MRIVDKVRSHIDEASYLYGLAGTVPARISVTWFLMRKKGAQLRNRVAPHHSFSEDATIPLYGSRHVVDLLGSEVYLLDEVYREHLYDRLPSFVPKASDTVVDVGANVGIFAVRQARRGARVFAFEPNPDCYRRLAKSVIENGLTDTIDIFNYAIGLTTGEGVMHVPNNQTALGSVVPRATAASGQSRTVRITSLDLILSALGVDHVDLLKIDTEGAEVDVLRGAARTLQATERVIVEYHSPELQRQVATLFHSHGFRRVLDVDTPAPYLPDAGVIYAEKDRSDRER